MAHGRLRDTIRLLATLGQGTLGQGADLSDGELLGRFIEGRDEAAFAALVKRHGPLVWGVCRRLLDHHQDAEDAFQAAFLVLARRAAAVVPRALLANWLHGVAYRTALKARSMTHRQRTREKPLTEVAEPHAGVWNDLKPLLDRELAGLPEKFRLVLLLCDLEGMTRKEAARQLQIPEGTLSSRLATARVTLARRLARHGVTLSGGALAALLAQHAASASTPAAALCATIKAAGLLAAGHSAAATISPNVFALMKGVMTMMALSKLKVPIVCLLLAVGASFFGAAPRAQTPHAETADGQNEEIWLGGPGSRADTREPPGDIQPGVIQPGDIRFLTANFVVVATSEKLARTIGQHAEAERERLGLLWLGQKPPTWRERCLIRVKSATKAAGTTRFEYGEQRLFAPRQEIHLEGPLPDLLQDTLPQQVTHTLLAHDLGANYPRWAQTGAGILAQSEPERRRQLAVLRAAMVRGAALPLAKLFALGEFPPDFQTMQAQSYAVTQFLVERKGRASFLAFVERGMHRGWDHAVERYYGVGSVALLQASWRKWLEEGERDFPAPELAGAAPEASNAAPWADKLFRAMGPAAHDFGTVPRGDKKVHRFQLKNVYKVPLEITNVRVTSSAVHAVPSTNRLQPNEVATIEVVLDTRRFTGRKTLLIYVTVGPEYISTAKLQVTANAQDADEVQMPAKPVPGPIVSDGRFDVTAAALVAYLRGHAERVPALRCLDLGITCLHGAHAVGLRGKLIAQRPRSIRISANLFGESAFELVSNDHECWLRLGDGKGARQFHGFDKDLAIDRAMPWPIYSDCLMAALGLGSYGPPARYTVEQDADTVRLVETIKAPLGKTVAKVIVFQRNAVAPPRPQVLACLLVDADTAKEILSARIKSTKLDPTTGAIVPFKMELRFKTDWPAQDDPQDVKLILTLNEAAVNPPLRKELFERPGQSPAAS